jgi:phosphoribosylaminoimidazole-succinocarboxamide synthase
MSADSKPSPPMHESQVAGLARLHQGKVRDIYAVDDGHMLIVTTDRLSAFDVVLPDPIPGKGRVLTQISNYWFALTRHIVPNHLSNYPLSRAVPDSATRVLLADRSMIVRRLTALPVEAVVRGYLIGSGWKDYQRTGEVCGIALPAGLELADRLPTPIFTPSTKAERGQHDENVGFAHIEALIGAARAAQVRDAAVALYAFAAELALRRGIIIADTKFEFGVDDAGTLTFDRRGADTGFIALLAGRYLPPRDQPAVVRQAVRARLSRNARLGQAPAPRRTCRRVIRRTSEKYQEALRRLTGEEQ